MHLLPPEQETKSLSLFSIRKKVAQTASYCSSAYGVCFPNLQLSPVGLDGTQGSPQKCWVFGKQELILGKHHFIGLATGRISHASASQSSKGLATYPLGMSPAQSPIRLRTQHPAGCRLRDTANRTGMAEV